MSRTKATTKRINKILISNIKQALDKPSVASIRTKFDKPFDKHTRGKQTKIVFGRTPSNNPKNTMIKY